MIESLTFILGIKFFIYYASWLVFPLLYLFIKQRLYWWSFFGFLFVYTRFIEPQIVLVHHYKINIGFKANYALISDIHLGIYNNQNILEKTVEKINHLNIDALLIAGDFTYEPQFSNMQKLFSPLSKIKAPIYAVLGNHDCQRPGPNIRKELVTILEKNGVTILNNEAKKLNGVTILGLGSNWAEEDDVGMLKNYRKEEDLIVLTHNPDTLYAYKNSASADITLAGHTHGGQIRLPYLYKKMIPVRGEVLWNQGEYLYKGNKLFVTSGIGEVGLPMRFLIPPTIDVLEFY